MGAISLMMTTALDAIDELGRKSDVVNDGYHFKYDSNTYGADDVTIKAGDEEFVLAVVWKKLPGYKPSLCNLRQAFDNYGWAVRDKEYIKNLEKEIKRLQKFEKNFKKIQKKCQELDEKSKQHYGDDKGVEYEMKLDDKLEEFLYL